MIDTNMTDIVQQVREMVDVLNAIDADGDINAVFWNSREGEELLFRLRDAYANSDALIAKVEAMQKALTEPPSDDVVEKIVYDQRGLHRDIHASDVLDIIAAFQKYLMENKHPLC